MQPVSSDLSFPALESKILKLWEAEQCFAASNIKRPGQPEFAFYDGPPFANGLPHYGHLLANTVKDVVPRYWSMRGHYVQRRFGWDCHGVPVEYELEKKLGLKGRAAIVEMGVDKFNEACRESVFAYAEEWQKTITRLGRWVDWSNQYRTLDLDFMESVWWVFSELYRKGYVYLGYKVVPYSPRISAVMSNFEANQNYKNVQDPAVTIKFRLVDEDAALLAWTTTPWSLVANLGLCVGPEIVYAKVRDLTTGESYYLSESRLEAYYPAAKAEVEPSYQLLGRVLGKDLVGRRYSPLFPFYAEHANSFQVVADSYVTVVDGTGIVHQAPAYGEDDFRIAKLHSITLVDPIDGEGAFKEPATPYVGLNFKDADKQIIADLKKAGLLFRHETLVHSYPFCDRTDTPLMYRAINTWYIQVEAHRDRLVAHNQTINWVPSHLKDGRMGQWLANANDWAVSRNRFWGTPIPIWVCAQNAEHRVCLGSVAELEKLSGAKVNDLHKHHIDQLNFACEQCGGKMQRIEEVFDCWFESGSMPYAQQHYPFANAERFAEVFPADFIAEGLDQTRGWFYTLAVLSTLLFDRPAFKNVIVNGIVLAEDGRKMSKRLKNYTAPEILLEELGADSVRLYMLNSAILRGENLQFTNKGVRDTTRSVLLPLWNALSFLTTYAAADGWKPSRELASGILPNVQEDLDVWIISRLQHLQQTVKTQMEAYELYKVVPEILGYIDELTNWYIRLSRRRFWGEGESLQSSTEEAYQTLYSVLLGFTKVLAPLAPFITEEIYRVLVADHSELTKSVHLCAMPEPELSRINRELEHRMELVATVTELGRSLRAKHQLKTRQVLRSMLIITRTQEDQDSIRRSASLVCSELNLKELQYTIDEAAHVNLAVKPNLRTLGPKLGSGLAAFRKDFATKMADFKQARSLLEAVADGGKAEILGMTLHEEDLLIERLPKDERLIASAHGVTVLLDTKLDADLIREGLARELVNRIQKLRKDSGFKVSDRISLHLYLSPELAEAASSFRDYILGETLGVSMELAPASEAGMIDIELDGQTCKVRLTRQD